MRNFKGRLINFLEQLIVIYVAKKVLLNLRVHNNHNFQIPPMNLFLTKTYRNI
jgi:hypothetical protein